MVQRRISPVGLGGAFRSVWSWALLAILALFSVGALFMPLVESFGQLGFDFRGTIWEPARAIIDGRSMYPEPTRAAMELGNPAVYPPFVPLLALPLAIVPVTVAAAVWTVLLALGTAWSLWLLGVRDGRCYLVAFVSVPVMQGLLVGNLTLLLLVPLAFAWRFRDRALVAGVAVGVGVAAKLFVWPLIVWLLITRRFVAAAWAVAAAVALVLVPWALVGFDGLLRYPALLTALQEHFAPRSFSLATLAASLGAPAPEASLFAGPRVSRCSLSPGGSAGIRTATGGPSRSWSSLALLRRRWRGSSRLRCSSCRLPSRGPDSIVAWFFGYLVVFVPLVPGLITIEPATVLSAFGRP